MKKLISILLVGILAISITACTAKEKEEETQTTTTAITSAQTETSTGTTQEQTNTQMVEVTANVLKTSDWNSYESAEYNGKDQMTVNIALPEGYTLDGTVINNADGKKYGEVIGVILLNDGQTPFDTIEVNDTHNDIKYIEKSTPDYTDSEQLYFTITSVKAQAPTDNGEGFRYISYYGVNFREYCVEISVFSDENFTDMPEEHKTLISSISVA